MNDQEAILGLREGNKAAFEYLYRSHCARIYNFARLYISSATDAEDVVQEVFVKLWEARHCLYDEGKFNGLLFIITRNIIFNRFRKSFNEEFYKKTVTDAVETSYSIEEELEASDLRAHIDCLVATLPPKQREIFKLSREEHLSYKEISSRMQISEKTVEHNISNALKFLKKNLKLYMIFISMIP